MRKAVAVGLGFVVAALMAFGGAHTPNQGAAGATTAANAPLERPWR